MTGKAWRRVVQQVGAGVAVVLLLGTSSAASAPFWPGPDLGDVVASAQADPDDPEVLDEAVQTTWHRGPESRADAVATASATCDGCHSRAVTVQVVLADRAWRGWTDADNVATAWATCRDCTAQAVAVQVVLVRGAAPLDVNNRALAITAGCTGCAVYSVAYQLVVQAGAAGVDPETLQQKLLTWARTQPAASETAPPAARTARRQTEDRLTTLESAVVDLVGGSVLHSNAALRRSG